MGRSCLAGLSVAALLGAPPALSADFAGAFYDPSGDALVVDIAYLGTHAEHDFELVWGPYSERPDAGRYTVVARIIDTHGRDHAREPYRVRERFDLAELECRPARVTLRMGRIAHVSVVVPGQP